eukprot:TRINITY_DN28518_c0_g1_i1.p1 TRINITY_DN28518_c0_g1~~TRINITY_DN28518_c0_g1_i1.p1  ORF type:complete len:802 (+),score=246.48 TRINITY_DN28518_c0_g1_i1:138-2408(+)
MQLDASHAAAACAACGVGAALGSLCTLARRTAASPLASAAPQGLHRLGEPMNPVLRYWFYSAPTDKLQHSLWFCGEGSERQSQVDAEIADMFAATYDAAVGGSWVPSQDSPFELLSHIIVVDQFGRHLARWRGATVDAAREHDHLALQSCELLFALPEVMTELRSTELVFALLPMRHHKSSTEAEKSLHARALDLLSRIEDRCIGGESNVAARFRSATLRRYQALCDLRSPAEGLLERDEFAPSPEVSAGIPKETLVRSVAKFLHNRGISFAQDGAACVSLSGGVDSMVIAHILCHLRDHPKPVERARKGQFKGAADRRVRHNVLESKTAGLVKKVVAVHIHYGNREASKGEADFLVDWCDRHGIELHVKSITDLRRGETSRDEYEALTRNIRFDEYRKVMRDGVRGICLGHHCGDVVENLLSNANRGSGLLELSGMSEVVLMEDVPTWRPLLLHDKDEIFEYAHRYGVPYFKDTTPSWSTRGKLRRNLLPCLKDTYGTGIEHNLHALALESDSMKGLLYGALVKPFMEASVQQHSLGVSIAVAGAKSHGRIFWKEVFKTVQHKIFNTSMLSEAGLREVSLRLALTGFEAGDENYVTEAQDGWLEPKRGMHWFLEKDVLYVPRPRLFATEFKTAPPLEVGSTAAVGGWHVSASLRSLSEEEEGDMRYSDHRSLPKPCRVVPFTAWPDFLSGSFSYCLAVPPGTSALTWQNDGCKTPWCWKQMHPKWLTFLPVACAPPLPSDDCVVVEVSYRWVEEA